MTPQGPDDQRLHCDGDMIMGMCRLSIIDVEGGAQPMTGETPRVYVVCRGEICNLRELRRELEAKGHRFATRVTDAPTPRSVTLLVHVSCGRELLRHCEWSDIFVQLSRRASNGDREGLPGALLVAMTAARPVVSTNHAGIPYAVRDGREGVLVSERDPAGLARCIRLLADDPALRQRLGSAGRRRACGLFDVDRQVARLEELYDDLARRGS